mmetsp:Transcript_61137/g.191702  ORF Transcript_61137/g.191702 Transcript_61137/m.191702 type:complete len:725 (+) Transcript_61137:224-2398(+)
MELDEDRRAHDPRGGLRQVLPFLRSSQGCSRDHPRCRPDRLGLHPCVSGKWGEAAARGVLPASARGGGFRSDSGPSDGLAAERGGEPAVAALPPGERQFALRGPAEVLRSGASAARATVPGAFRCPPVSHRRCGPGRLELAVRARGPPRRSRRGVGGSGKRRLGHEVCSHASPHGPCVRAPRRWHQRSGPAVHRAGVAEGRSGSERRGDAHRRCFAVRRAIRSAHCGLRAGIGLAASAGGAPPRQGDRPGRRQATGPGPAVCRPGALRGQGDCPHSRPEARGRAVLRLGGDARGQGACDCSGGRKPLCTAIRCSRAATGPRLPVRAARDPWNGPVRPAQGLPARCGPCLGSCRAGLPGHPIRRRGAMAGLQLCTQRGQDVQVEPQVCLTGVMARQELRPRSRGPGRASPALCSRGVPEGPPYRACCRPGGRLRSGACFAGAAEGPRGRLGRGGAGRLGADVRGRGGVEGSGVCLGGGCAVLLGAAVCPRRGQARQGLRPGDGDPPWRSPRLCRAGAPAGQAGRPGRRVAGRPCITVRLGGSSAGQGRGLGSGGPGRPGLALRGGVPAAGAGPRLHRASGLAELAGRLRRFSGGRRRLHPSKRLLGGCAHRCVAERLGPAVRPGGVPEGQGRGLGGGQAVQLCDRLRPCRAAVRQRGGDGSGFGRLRGSACGSPWGRVDRFILAGEPEQVQGAGPRGAEPPVAEWRGLDVGHRGGGPLPEAAHGT